MVVLQCMDSVDKVTVTVMVEQLLLLCHKASILDIQRDLRQLTQLEERLGDIIMEVAHNGPEDRELMVSRFLTFTSNNLKQNQTFPFLIHPRLQR